MTLGVDEWIWDGQHFRASDWAGQGYADPTKGYAACQAAAFRHLTSGDAQGARDAAIAARDAAATIKAAVEALVGQVTAGSTTALAFPSVDKALLTAADVVAVAVYDTRVDDDGGAWRLRCRRTSWWAEALNTTTRGARRDFPMVAAIVARATSLTIYDALDLDPVTGTPRMWMVFQRGGSGGTLAATTALASTSLSAVLTSVSARSGRVYVGQAGAGNGALDIIDFPRDEARLLQSGTSFCGVFRGGLAQRNSALGHRVDAAISPIVATDVLAVHAQVLPGAPLDPVSGLPVPTVAVATSAGVSVIHPWGQVCDITRAAPGFHRALIQPSGRILLSRPDGSTIDFGPLPYADVAFAAWRSGFYVNGTYVPDSVNVVLADGAAGGAGGLVLFAEDTANTANTMTARVAIAYSTGWMPGDIRGAYLCDGATGTITGALVVDDDCSSLAGWTTGTGWSHDAAGTEFDHAAGNTAPLTRSITGLTAGQVYLVRVGVGNRSAGSVTVSLANATDEAGAISVSTNGTHLVQFTAAGATDALTITPSSDFDGSIQSARIDVATADRSYQGKGLVIVGTLVRAAAASGADMAAWSGWGAGAYLEQPYNSALDFGTSDFGIFGRTVFTSTIGGNIVARGATSGPLWRVYGNGSVMSASITDGTTTAVVSSGTVSVGQECLWGVVKRGSVLELWLNGLLAGTASTASVGSLTNTSAVLRVGQNVTGGGPLGSDTAVSMLRVTAYAPTPAQIRRMYDDERTLFQPGAKCLLGGSNIVQSLSYDDSRAVLAVGTAQGTSLFHGLTRTAYNPCASAASANHKAVGMAGGVLLIGTAAQAAVYQDAIVGKEAVLDRARPRPAAEPLFVVSDNGAVVDVAPRIFVGPREHVTVESRFTGRVYGPTDSERLAYTRRVDVYRDAAGNVTIDGTVQTIGGDREQSAAADFTFVVDTAAQTVTERLTGVTGKRIEGTVTRTVTRISEENSYAA